jgi:hypothetical protein
MLEIPIILGIGIIIAAIREVFFKKPLYNDNNREEIIIIVDQFGEIVRIYYDKDRIINSANKINNNTIVYLCDDETNICPLTQETIPLNTEIRKLNCGHFFTKERIDIWLGQNNKCPLCRENVIH